jgi:hypothetical protein
MIETSRISGDHHLGKHSLMEERRPLRLMPHVAFHEQSFGYPYFPQFRPEVR